MLSNEQAARELHAAILVLLRAYDQAKGAEKTRIGMMQRVLTKEYLQLLGLEPSKDYGALTAEFSAASGRIQGLIDRRQQFTQDAQTAAQVLSTLTAVLRLFT